MLSFDRSEMNNEQYTIGTWGPPDAKQLIEREGGNLITQQYETYKQDICSAAKFGL